MRGLKWPARRVAPPAPPGVHPSRVRGAAPEFTEYRAFRQGDDPRRLDWKLLARTDRVFFRLADERALLGTTLVLDASPSMDFPAGSAERRAASKWRVAGQLATALAQVAHQSGDPIGLIVPGAGGANGGERVVPPRTRRGIVTEIADAIGSVQPGPSRLAATLTRTRLPSRVVLISDFLDDDGEMLRAATAHCARGGEVLAIEVIAREELEPPTSPFTALDPENSQLARPFGPAAHDEYRRRFAAWRDETAHRWRAAGPRWIEICTDDPVAAAVRRIVAA